MFRTAPDTRRDAEAGSPGMDDMRDVMMPGWRFAGARVGCEAESSSLGSIRLQHRAARA